MINKGIYRVVQILDVSHSLQSQKDEEPQNDSGSIKKCIMVNEVKQIIAYFVDLPTIGQDTEISLLNDLEIPLIYKKDIRILKKSEYIHDVSFIKRLSKPH